MEETESLRAQMKDRRGRKKTRGKTKAGGGRGEFEREGE